MRVGIGYDVHRLVEGRKLVLGGVEIEYHLGLEGHSDADVLTHAICDAILGAASLGDIGKHFPPSDPQYKNISSLILLERVAKLIAENGFKIMNIDATIICESPKLAPYIGLMKNNISASCYLSESRVSIKATTNEGLGFEGKGLGIAAFAVALLTESWG